MARLASGPNEGDLSVLRWNGGAWVAETTLQPSGDDTFTYVAVNQDGGTIVALAEGPRGALGEGKGR